MARVSGDKTALVVVDVQVGVMPQCWDTERVVGNIATAVERARAEGVPVIWVQHGDDDLRRDTPAWQWVPELVPAAGERRVYKSFNSAFEDTDLAAQLEELGVSHVVLAGAQSNWCIRATAYGALDRGFDLTLVKDAHTTENIEMRDGTVLTADHIVRDLNIAMTWVSYPERRNTAADVAELKFKTPVSG